MIYLVNIFKSKYCLAVFGLSLWLSYFLVPKTIFYQWDILLGILFIISFSLIITCLVRNVKEKVVIARAGKSSFFGILGAGLGLAVLQSCGLGAPVCGAALGWGVFSSIFPAVFIKTMSQYALIFISFSLVLQLTSLYFMNCFKNLPAINVSKRKS